MSEPEVPEFTYTADHPPRRESSDDLRARIPGWGADLDHADRPSVPRERGDLEVGVPWRFPERQVEERPRERSIEHGTLPPVFGTAQPLRGLSGAVRRLSYRRYSEARLAHWLLLVLADRVDVGENRVLGLVRGKPDRLVRETGVRGEVSHHGLSSRRGRSDVKHQWLDPVLVMGPWVLGGVVAARVVRRLARG